MQCLFVLQLAGKRLAKVSLSTADVRRPAAQRPIKERPNLLASRFSSMALTGQPCGMLPKSLAKPACRMKPLP